MQGKLWNNICLFIAFGSSSSLRNEAVFMAKLSPDYMLHLMICRSNSRWSSYQYLWCSRCLGIVVHTMQLCWCSICIAYLLDLSTYSLRNVDFCHISSIVCTHQPARFNLLHIFFANLGRWTMSELMGCCVSLILVYTGSRDILR